MSLSLSLFVLACDLHREPSHQRKKNSVPLFSPLCFCSWARPCRVCFCAVKGTNVWLRRPPACVAPVENRATEEQSRTGRHIPVFTFFSYWSGHRAPGPSAESLAAAATRRNLFCALVVSWAPLPCCLLSICLFLLFFYYKAIAFEEFCVALPSLFLPRARVWRRQTRWAYTANNQRRRRAHKRGYRLCRSLSCWRTILSS